MDNVIYIWRCCDYNCRCVLDVEFTEGETEHFVEIEILYDGEREMREAFTVHMKPDDNMVAEIQVGQMPHVAYKHTNTNLYLHTHSIAFQHTWAMSMRRVSWPSLLK